MPIYLTHKLPINTWASVVLIERHLVGNILVLYWFCQAVSGWAVFSGMSERAWTDCRHFILSYALLQLRLYTYWCAAHTKKRIYRLYKVSFSADKVHRFYIICNNFEPWSLIVTGELIFCSIKWDLKVHIKIFGFYVLFYLFIYIFKYLSLKWICLPGLMAFMYLCALFSETQN